MLGNKFKTQKGKFKTKTQSLKFLVLSFSFAFCLFSRFALSCFAQEPFVYDAKGKRNPFIPLVTADGRLLRLDKEEAQGDLSIEGIIYDKHGRSFAIVNGGVVGIGDRVGDYQVLDIQDKKVTFIKEGQTQDVEIKKEAE